MYDFYVSLGCFGLVVDGFTSCGGVENTVLKIHSGLFNYNGMMDYFDQCRLFDKPMFDVNAIRHFIFNLQNNYDQLTKPIWSPKKFELYQKFILDHRHCGLQLKLRLPDETVIEKETEPEIILSRKLSEVEKPPTIESELVTPAPLHRNNLRLLRGRR